MNRNNINKKDSVSLIRPPLFSDEMAKLCEELNHVAREVDRNRVETYLDYSVESVEMVEIILDQLHNKFNTTRNDNGLNGLAMVFGAYIIQVIEQNFSAGIWEQDDAVHGPATFPYQWEGRTLLPVVWCAKRIFEGDEEENNVWEKFNALVVEHWRRTRH